MTQNSLEKIAPLATHSHEERWIPASDLPRDLKELTQDILPILKRIKRLVIGLAALSMDRESRGRVLVVANELRSFASRSSEEINEHRDTPNKAVIAEPIVAALRQIDIWAEVVVTHGLSAEAASGLRSAYRSLRLSCQVLWPSELIPEGRPVVSEAIYG